MQRDSEERNSEKCRNMQINVGKEEKCREMQKTSEECRAMQRNAEKWREMQDDVGGYENSQRSENTSKQGIW